jgi:hypothetical protein
VRDTRVGTVERAQVLGLLGEALDAGLLPIEEYDARVVAVGTANHAAELRRQLGDLPPEYAWEEPDAAPSPAADRGSAAKPASTAAGRVALILGIASVPLSICVIGGILGVLAVLASARSAPPAPGRRVTAALVGRVFGILGIVLSIGALIALLYARDHSVGP